MCCVWCSCELSWFWWWELLPCYQVLVVALTYHLVAAAGVVAFAVAVQFFPLFVLFFLDSSCSCWVLISAVWASEFSFDILFFFLLYAFFSLVSTCADGAYEWSYACPLMVPEALASEATHRLWGKRPYIVFAIPPQVYFVVWEGSRGRNFHLPRFDGPAELPVPHGTSCSCVYLRMTSQAIEIHAVWESDNYPSLLLVLRVESL